MKGEPVVRDGGATWAATAAILRPDDPCFRIEPVTVGPPRADEVVVEIVATGICHAEMAVRDRLLPAPLPIILGHEGAGHVVACGDSVTRLKVGDSVVLSYLSCGDCRECNDGSPANCGQFGALGLSGHRPDGSHAVHSSAEPMLNDRFFGQSSFATIAVANERNAVKVDADVPLEMLGPLGCGVMTGAGAIWNELRVTPGSSLAVFGAGAVGLSAVMAARVAGAGEIVAVDRVESRLECALELGATRVVVAGTRVARSGGFDFALDTTGDSTVIAGAIACLGQRGTVGYVGHDPRRGPLPLDLGDMLSKSKRLIAIVEGGGSSQLMIPKLVDLYRAGHFPFDRMIRLYPFEAINDAVADSEAGRTVKPVLVMR